jgi:hypothetical protein
VTVTLVDHEHGVVELVNAGLGRFNGVDGFTRRRHGVPEREGEAAWLTTTEGPA